MNATLLLFAALALAGRAAGAQTLALNPPPAAPREAATPAAIRWQQTAHHFGEIRQSVPVTACFGFVNTSAAPVFITQVQGSCGCTATDYPRQAVPPGKSARIAATYNAANPGAFHKTVTVTTTADAAGPQVLSLQGTVLAGQ